MDKKMTENVQLATRIKQMRVGDVITVPAEREGYVRPLCSNVKYTTQKVYSVKRSDSILIITRNS